MLDLPTRHLHGPGPSPVPPSVLEALGQPCIGHMDPAFMRVMNEVREMLQQVFGTENEMTLACSGTGSAGAEMLMDNLVEPGDACLIGVNGVFGGRLTDKARRAGGVVTNLHADWGQSFSRTLIKEKVAELKPKIVCFVHAETSTGTLQPFEGLADAVHEHGGLLVMDCVTSLAGRPVELDAWGVDAAYSGTQKCLSCPPGLSPVSLSERAMEKVRSRKTKPNSWYLDLNLVGNYWSGSRAYHHTAPVNMNFALHEALRLVLEEGLEVRYARHRRVHERLKAGLETRGFRYASDPEWTLPMLNLVSIPDRVDDEAAVRKRLLLDHHLEIGGGLGALAGKCWRIGLMGHGATDEAVDRILAGLDAVL
ncbi:pyridoxal-phosphate-dependent aminotransferase family protein [Phycisphaera mikurensis]|uniref:Aminotransferase n=1 Tax=Phycisphaera mikurensis (strain NBRC 102666 / KCTC 22515 / FYK2301M01) TaxID=1142394 RepID=I0IIY9_PHYMF|nr:aminotransferase class V-fold PLP-dependent enzyme [Phycisphaera mikurensis]MBB6443074.1 alanine-glyoxylate transaminase/serine-glyoxylate transaminase/serine-pyruvate transaminase [Phycisphaera mikurensis]BAM05227.1 aminotransferase [Phycisphaera mikurensis NBRC 102666]